MKYYFNINLTTSFDDAVTRVIDALKKEGFGVLSEIDIQATLKKKLDVDFRKYKILGACNPPFAYKALQIEDNIGLLLPCNLIIQEAPDGSISVAAIDPLASMSILNNVELSNIAEEIQKKLKRVIESL